jgi:uncharacterized membrane protein YgcG
METFNKGFTKSPEVFIMKRFIKLAAVLLLCGLLLGAERPAAGVYLLDPADVIFREHRDFVLETSLQVKLDTGVEVAVATAEELQGLSIEAYASGLAAEWGLGGGGGGYLLLLYCPLTGEAFLKAGPSPQEGLFSETEAAAFPETEMRGYLDEGKYSKAVFEGYKAVVRAVYARRGIEPGSSLAASLEPGAAPNQVFWTSLAFIGAMIIMLRSFYVSRKYRQKYAAGGSPAYRRKRFARPVQDIEFDIIREEASDGDEDKDARFDRD